MVAHHSYTVNSLAVLILQNYNDKIISVRGCVFKKSVGKRKWSRRKGSHYLKFILCNQNNKIIWKFMLHCFQKELLHFPQINLCEFRYIFKNIQPTINFLKLYYFSNFFFLFLLITGIGFYSYFPIQQSNNEILIVEKWFYL